ncbi:conserved hypothetical protein [Candidatus Desulfarcum epimagneticum]|uniref:Aminotransferase class I/classII large domain-containing protein n=1 Tax=uncultured Desulfobacteraceae bacterium TaxID=218296 RepID=A0A484HBL9_9BACT|nr:conserved hypothetical protein [uncultured Desulfobacteraceae bacterium]
MNPIAKELNETIRSGNMNVYDMLSEVGQKLFFPKGILSQSAEAKEKAHRINATIGIAKEDGDIMCFPSVKNAMGDVRPEESLTYAPSFGIPALRGAWRKSLFEKNPSLEGKNVSLPVATCGITHSISIFADMWLDPGDVVIAPEMMWGNYNMILNVRKNVRLSHYELFSQNRGLNLEAFENQIKAEASKNKKITVLLNFPQNPSGYTATKEEGEAIVRILTQTAEAGSHVLAVFDDAYFGLFYEDSAMRESLFARLCDAHPRLLAAKLDGATKENYVWGLRVGFVTYGCPADGDPAAFYEALEKKTAGCVRGNISNASHLSQTLVLKSMNSESYAAEKREKYDTLKKRAMKVKEVLKNEKYADAWEPYPFNSGYFMCLKLKTVDAETLRVHLLDQYGVGLISMGKTDLRVAFSCLDEKDVTDLFETIFAGVRDLESGSK